MRKFPLAALLSILFFSLPPLLLVPSFRTSLEGRQAQMRPLLCVRGELKLRKMESPPSILALVLETHAGQRALPRILGKYIKERGLFPRM